MMRFIKHKISFCIVCMNRLHQLKETLLQNIQDNADYDELEYIVLDYNSKDGMEDWAKENLTEYIASGKVIYYRTPEPETFSHSHSKNMAFKLASGAIVCSINADHYTGKGFADYVNKAYNENESIVLTTIDFHGTQKNYFPAKDVFGRVCVKKSDFLKVKGFDERMNQYGNEDFDFINRLELTGLKRVFIEDFSFLNFIAHSQEERYSLDEENLLGIYVRYSEPFASELLMMYKNGQFKSGLLINNENLNADDIRNAYKSKRHRYKLNIKDPGWQKGIWKDNLNERSLDFYPNGTIPAFRLEKNIINTYDVLESKTGKIYYALTNAANIKKVTVFDYFFHNRSIMEKNLENRKISVNDTGFGDGMLFKNFQYPAI